VIDGAVASENSNHDGQEIFIPCSNGGHVDLRRLRNVCPLLESRPAAGTREGQSSRWTIVQLMEKPELPNSPPPGPVIKPSWTNVRI